MQEGLLDLLPLADVAWQLINVKGLVMEAVEDRRDLFLRKVLRDSCELAQRI